MKLNKRKTYKNRGKYYMQYENFEKVKNKSVEKKKENIWKGRKSMESAERL